MLFCGNCGAANEDGASFCSNCGKPLPPQIQLESAPAPFPNPEDAAPPPERPPEPTPPKPRIRRFFRKHSATGRPSPAAGSKRKGLVLLGAAATAALVLIVVLVTLLSSRSADAAATQAVRAVFKPDTQRIFTRLTPKNVLESFLSELDYDRTDLADQCSDMDALIREMERNLSDGLDARLKFSYAVRRSKDYSSRDLRTLRESYLENYNVKVTDAKTVTVRVTVKAGREQEHFDVEDVTVLKAGRNWYIELGSFVTLIQTMRNDLTYLFY